MAAKQNSMIFTNKVKFNLNKHNRKKEHTKERKIIKKSEKE